MATVGILLGAVTGILGLLDIFLSKSQKEKLEEMVLRTWDWLSDARRVSLVGWVLQPGRRAWFFVAAVTITLGGAYYMGLGQLPRDEAGTAVTVMLIAGIVVGGLLGQAILRHILSRPPTAAPFWAVFYIFLTPIVCAALVISGVLHRLGNAANYFARGTKYHGLDDMDLEALFTMFYAASVTEVFTLIATLPLLVVAFAQAFLFVSEGIVRKIAESPKGVVLTLSALVTAGASILKAFA